MQIRASLERTAIDALLAGVGPLPRELALHGGLGADNRCQPSGWNLARQQWFQFGDLRLEGRSVRVVVEVESAGGETNLVKYWPMLESGLRDKRFVLVHLFRMTSVGDYVAHRELWRFLLTRMRSDLDSRCGLRWERDWHATLFTYGSSAPPPSINDAALYVRNALQGVTA